MAEKATVENDAVASVARHFGVDRLPGDGPAEAFLVVVGRKIHLKSAVIMRKNSARVPTVPARLRDDVVARRVLADLESAVGGRVPDGKMLLVTLGAPIKVPGRLVGSLAGTMLASLETGGAGVEKTAVVLGNRFRFRVGPAVSRRAVQFAGFVFTGDPTTGALLQEMSLLNQAIESRSKAAGPNPRALERWLVLASDRWIADIKTYRRMFTMMRPRHRFQKILLSTGGRRVELLAETGDGSPGPNHGL